MSHVIRTDLEKLVEEDLLGPFGGDEEEVDESRVSDRYLVGMLAPQKQTILRETDEDLGDGGTPPTEDGAADPNAAPTETTFPSSIGLTFSVSPNAGPLTIEATWGRYKRTESEHLETEAGNPKQVWKRIPMSGSVDALDLSPGDVGPMSLNAEQPDIVLRGVVRERGDDLVVSLFMVNMQVEPDRLRDEMWVFQPELVVSASSGEPVFQRRAPERDQTHMDPEAAREAAEMAMVYRRDIEFAVGHGVAVHAVSAEEDPTRAAKLQTRVVPWHDVCRQEAPTPADPGFEGLDDAILDMEVLAGLGTTELAEALRPLADEYERWIEREGQKADDPAEGLGAHEDAARESVVRCRRAVSRIREGIELITANEMAADAFRFSNRAMWQQRIHSILSERKRRGEEDVDLAEIDSDPKNHSWWPFQLAFVLLNLPTCTDLHHPDRSDDTEAIADLLWFPTGGGKTEAYLGLAAYTMALRRLQGTLSGHDGEHGVTVLMRYTLRLLTLQQFQRAAALLCGCEMIRREEPGRWGKEVFRIGLWVGASSTPNWTRDAGTWVAEAKGRGGQRGSGGKGSPAQLTNCPWCGTKIVPGRDIQVEEGMSKSGRTLMYCGDQRGRCLFSKRKASGEGLPVVVVDEEVYRMLPSMLIATVDKFAQMPWNGRTQMLFGRVQKHCERHGFITPEVEDRDSHRAAGGLPAVTATEHSPLRPPDLIIQDELHLISGPLGSMVGLYETVVDELCSWHLDGRRVRPKVVASTATIRSAQSQVNQLFLRRVEIFPPSGTWVGDNFFSLRRLASPEHPARRYVGICAPGKRLKAVLIRVYVALLSAAQKLYEQQGEDVDPWMTLVGYFNSLRELGGMRRLVDDDARMRLRRMSERGLADRPPPIVEELTSRRASSDIPYVLDRLELPFSPKADEERAKARKERRQPKPRPYDVLLATNMVSVGVDVQRLGLMVVAGQPKTTAEYIQATSRVGRRHPGLVVTVYNWARPRDLSHYERFEHYHATFYERVESLSVTPFAARALDRGLSALLVSLVRLQDALYNDNPSSPLKNRCCAE